MNAVRHHDTYIAPKRRLDQQTSAAPSLPSLTGAKTRVFAPLHWIEWSLIVVTVIVCLWVAFKSIQTHSHISQMEEKISLYSENVNVLNIETDIISSDLYRDYNYEMIKKIAEEQNMSINASRVKDVTHR